MLLSLTAKSKRSGRRVKYNSSYVACACTLVYITHPSVASGAAHSLAVFEEFMHGVAPRAKAATPRRATWRIRGNHCIPRSSVWCRSMCQVHVLRLQLALERPGSRQCFALTQRSQAATQHLSVDRLHGPDIQLVAFALVATFLDPSRITTGGHIPSTH